MTGPADVVRSVLQAVGTFVVTNVDDLLMLALFFARAGRARAARARVVAGQYLGFGAILVISIVVASAATLLPRGVLPYLGLVPLLLGLRAAWTVWRDRSSAAPGDPDVPGAPATPPRVWEVAAVTLANGGDNVGVYSALFATAPARHIAAYCAVFLAGVVLWCWAATVVVTRPMIARPLARWGHILFPAALLTIGTTILAEAL